MARPRKARADAEAPTAAGALRDRVVEFRRVPAAELLDNEKNWRTHPYAQRQALSELLEKVGIAGALVAYHSKRNGGKLTLIDGHARKEDHDVEWPTLILDVDDDEADLLLLTYDPIAELAESNAGRLKDLTDRMSTGTTGLEDLIRNLAQRVNGADGEEAGEEESPASGPPEMELQAFEHYDYLVVLFRSPLDWTQAAEKLGIGTEAFTLRDGETRKIGRGRVVDGSRLLELLQ